MAWSGGTYTRDNGDYTGADVWADDKTNGFPILASRHDTHDQDLATGINACLTKDGSNSPSAQFTWLKSQYYGGTSGGTSTAHTITMSPAHTSYQTGELIIFKPGALNTGASTLNKNSLGAKTIKRMDGNDLQPGDLDTTRMAAVVYDGSNYILISAHEQRVVSRSTTYSSTNNSTTETDLLSYTVPANLLRTGRKLRARLNFHVTNTSGGSINYTVKAKFGLSTFDTQVIAIDGATSSIPIFVDIELSAANSSTTAQSALSHIRYINGFTSHESLVYADPARDITSALDLKVTVTMGTASASAGFTSHNAFVELL